MPNKFGAKYIKLLTLVTMTANVTDSDKTLWKIFLVCTTQLHKICNLVNVDTCTQENCIDDTLTVS